MQNKRHIEILTGVVLLMLTATSLVALMMCPLLAIDALIAIGTFVSACILWSANLVPRFISTLGFAGVLIIVLRDASTLAGIVERSSAWIVATAIPILSYDVALALLLIAKGFNEAKMPPPQKQNLFQLAKNQ